MYKWYFRLYRIISEEVKNLFFSFSTHTRIICTLKVIHSLRLHRSYSSRSRIPSKIERNDMREKVRHSCSTLTAGSLFWRQNWIPYQSFSIQSLSIPISNTRITYYIFPKLTSCKYCNTVKYCTFLFKIMVWLMDNFTW